MARRLGGRAGLRDVEVAAAQPQSSDLTLTYGDLPGGHVGAVVGKSAVTAIAHLRLPIDEMTSDETRAHLTGALADWRAVGAPYSLPVRLFALACLPTPAGVQLAGTVRIVATADALFIFDQDWSQATREGFMLHLYWRGTTLAGIRFVPTLIEHRCQPRIMTPAEAVGVFLRMWSGTDMLARGQYGPEIEPSLRLLCRRSTREILPRHFPRATLHTRGSRYPRHGTWDLHILPRPPGAARRPARRACARRLPTRTAMRRNR